MVWLRVYLDRGSLSPFSLLLVRNATYSSSNSYADGTASTVAFRDALLYRHPVILDAFLQKAVDLGDDDVSVFSLQTNPC